MDNSDRRITELVQLYPAFRAAVAQGPECCKAAILLNDLDSELAAERDALLAETAALYQRWYDLGQKISEAGTYVM